MKVGIFDHLDDRGVPLKQFYADRLALVERYDQLGFYAYHVAEHHATPLGLAPSPGIFLSAVAQRTQQLRFGSLVYILPLYHPLRLAEEICMLDQMSGGRLQVGVGRGISPIEVAYYGVDVPQSQAIYLESFEVLMQALHQPSVTHTGKYFQYTDVPMILKPLQTPHPPLWYGVGQIEGVDWCVDNKVNAVVNGSFARVREMTDRFRDRWAATGHPAGEMPLVGTGRHIVIAQTDEAARAIATRGYARWIDSFMLLWRQHNKVPQFALFAEDFKAASEAGIIFAGTANTVRDTVLEFIERTGVNYFLARFAFGDLTLAESMESTEQFAAQVMPALKMV